MSDERLFLAEARAHQAVLVDEGQSRTARLQAAQALRDAAERAGQASVRECAGELEDAFRRRTGGTPHETLAYLALLLDQAGQSPRPPAPSFDPEETEMLQRMFREEAQEHLEGLTQAVLALERDPTRRGLLDELLRKTHTMKGSAATVGMTAAAEAAHLFEDVLAQLRRSPERVADLACDAMIQAIDTLRAVVEAAPAEAPPLVVRLRLQLSALTLAARPRPLVPDTGPPPAPPATALIDQTIVLRRRRPRNVTQPIVVGPEDLELVPRESLRPDGETIPPGMERRRDEHQVLRIDAARVDRLMDGAGELVFDRTRIERRVQEMRGIVRDLGKVRGGLRNMVGQLRTKSDGLLGRMLELEEEFAANVAELSRSATALLDDTDALRRTTAALQEGLTQVRMTSVKWLFQRLARPLRDFERREDKRVELVTAGEDTELDRAVVEKITDPLIQLLRNALAHGIEPAPARLKRGKGPIGRITLSARHQGDSVFVEVADDGAGVDPDKIRAALVAAGRLTADAARAATDERMIAAIFEPGVSTRESADELAGRGVGLDVVRDTIARLGGEITVTSLAGEGSRFVIRLPLTTAISQAFLFKVGGQVYAIPNVHVVDTTQIEVEAATLPETLPSGGRDVPLVPLHRLLGAELPSESRRLPAVVLEFAGRRLGAPCDKVIGAREIVVKSLGPLLAPLGLFAGGTISGSGKVQIILDPAALASFAYPQGATAEGAVPRAIAETGATSRPATTGPLVPPAQSLAGTVPRTSPRAPAARRARILVADDSRSVREALSRMLGAEGHIVDLAGDGWDAWEMLHEVRYDLLVSDLEMPRLGGHQLVERIRGSGDFPDLRIVVISSRTAATHRDRALQAGADRFLPKPVSRQSLGPAVAELLG